MADNYLERKMEEHRSGGAPRYRRQLTPTGGRVGDYALRFEPRSVFISAVHEPASHMADFITEFRKTGSPVAFTLSDTAVGNRLSQSSGARYYPPQTLGSDGLPEGLTADVRIDVGQGECRVRFGSAGAQTVTVKFTELSAEVASRFMVFMLCRGNEPLLSGGRVYDMG